MRDVGADSRTANDSGLTLAGGAAQQPRGYATRVVRWVGLFSSVAAQWDRLRCRYKGSKGPVHYRPIRCLSVDSDLAEFTVRMGWK